MGRHRTDPIGFGRLALAGLAIVLVIALLVIGGRALFSSLDTPAPSSPSPPAATTPTAAPPTLRIECVADTCPLVVVRVPGGDVLQNREMTKGEVVSYTEPELDVVIEDAATVRVTENGVPRPQGKPGQQEEFTVTSGGSPVP